MQRPRPSCGIALCLLVFSLSGCGRSEVDDGEPQLPAWLTQEDPATDASSIVLAAAETAEPPRVETAALQLTLSPGESFPLRKLIEQELKQASLDGVPQISRSSLELSLSIRVDSVEAGRKRLGVLYDRVRYAHEVAGEEVSYDSTSPPSPVPAAALAYHGLIGRGFSLELGPDNQVAGVIGFREFLEGCLQHVPAEQRQRVLVDVEANAGENGIADFVDHTIGLLPADITKALGETWERDRHIVRPIPMHIRTSYTLTGLNDSLASIGIAGTISPSTTLGDAAPADQNVRIVVRGGHCEGHCTLYRESGLPKESRVVQVVDMTVQLAGGIEFNQQSRTVTTVETGPARSTAAADGGADGEIPSALRFQ